MSLRRPGQVHRQIGLSGYSVTSVEPDTEIMTGLVQDMERRIQSACESQLSKWTFDRRLKAAKRFRILLHPCLRIPNQ